MNFRIKRLIKKITGKCYDISTSTNADLFSSYSGHVSSLSVYGYSKGWNKLDANLDINFNVYLDHKEPVENLKKLYRHLVTLEKELKGER